MIRVLTTGTLFADPQARTSQAGKPFTTAKLKADGKDGATVWVSLVAFQDLAERLATLKAGAAIAVSGRAELSAKRYFRADSVPRDAETRGLALTFDSHNKHFFCAARAPCWL